MIALSSDCLLFQTPGGDSIPFSAEMISIELMGNSSKLLDSDFVKQASKAVFHYFRNELRRETVTVAEFADALEKVLRSFGYRVQSDADIKDADSEVIDADLQQLATEAAGGCELFFFPRLRDELRLRLKREPRMVRFHGLRGCVKQLTGARRWSNRCQTLEEKILQFLRECLSAETPHLECALLVD
ncbi:MAG TPA: hypothetical protein VK327_09640 [Candidatus Paceibacterota bacterium]|nr:hypothetical protein [Candidatus Paceibacterota bacterium]